MGWGLCSGLVSVHMKSKLPASLGMRSQTPMQQEYRNKKIELVQFSGWLSQMI